METAAFGRPGRDAVVAVVNLNCVECLVQVGNGIELDTVGRRFEPYRYNRWLRRPSPWPGTEAVTVSWTLVPNCRPNKAAANLRLKEGSTERPDDHKCRGAACRDPEADRNSLRMRETAPRPPQRRHSSLGREGSRSAGGERPFGHSSRQTRLAAPLTVRRSVLHSRPVRVTASAPGHGPGRHNQRLFA